MRPLRPPASRRPPLPVRPVRRRTRPPAPALTVALAAVAFLTACGDGGDGGSAGGSGGTAVARGEEIVSSRGCSACHSTDGSSSPGPTFQGAYGSRVTLEDGTTVTADEAYLRRAVQDPSAQVAEGYAVTMPVNDLTPAQVDDVVAYIRSLGD